MSRCLFKNLKFVKERSCLINMTEESKENLDSKISYKKAADYWSGVDPTIDGMLGGFGKISQIDIEGSNKFLKALFKMTGGPGNQRSLDCGSGIGRITKHLLQRHFIKVDLAEQNPKFLEKAKDYLQDSGKIGDLFCSGLQDFTPQKSQYDVIWCQWVLGHLTDADLQKFFIRCIYGLKANGILIVKENMTSSGEVEHDETDSSVTRPESILKQIFESSGLVIVREMQQLKFPKDIYPVKMFALRPK